MAEVGVGAVVVDVEAAVVEVVDDVELDDDPQAASSRAAAPVARVARRGRLDMVPPTDRFFLTVALDARWDG
jgi:hypothetical protein